MKKRLGIESLRSHEVPADLDIRIMARASFSIRQRKTARRRRHMFLAAAAAVCMSFGITAYHLLLTGQTAEVHPRRIDSGVKNDLASLADLSKLEQEMFVLNQTSAAWAMYDFEDSQI